MRPLFPHNHSPEYLMHKFWSRKPHNIIAAYIANYSADGDVVLDPFGGSGVTINEALRLGRRGISIDANELATFITKNTLAMVDPDAFEATAKSILEIARKNIVDLYVTRCQSCRGNATITHVLWRDVIACPCGSMLDLPTNARDQDVFIECTTCGSNVQASSNRVARPFSIYYECPSCQARIKDPDEDDLHLIASLENSVRHNQVLAELPSLSLPLVYPDGMPFQQLRHGMRSDPVLRNLFTARNLIAVHAIWRAILDLKSENGIDQATLDMIFFLFSSMLPQASKMVWIIKQRARKALKKSEVGSWTHHFLWNPTEYFEVNVINGYLERLAKILNGLRAKKAWYDGSQYWCKVCVDDECSWWLAKFTELVPSWQVLRTFTPLFLQAASDAQQFFEDTTKTALLLTMPSQNLEGIPGASIDYIFADPPYGDSIQYAELAAFFLSWFHPADFGSIVKEAREREITINRGQGKDLKTYGDLLGQVFRECFRVLKPGKHMTLTFHDTDSRVRALLYDAMLVAGFDFGQATYQPPPRPSEKSLLHEFGSPTGDYFITFKKNLVQDTSSQTLHKIQVIHETMREALDTIFIQRAEPVPFNYLLSLLDMQLASMGYMPPDMHKSLQTFLQGESDYSWRKNEGWFFTDNAGKCSVKNKPLQQRVEEYIGQFLAASSDLHGSQLVETVINTTYARFNGILTPELKKLKQFLSQDMPPHHGKRE